MKFKEYKPRTVGDLCEALSEYPPDTPIECWGGTGYESGGGTLIALRLDAIRDIAKPFYEKVTRRQDVSNILRLHAMHYDEMYSDDGTPYYADDEEIDY